MGGDEARAPSGTVTFLMSDVVGSTRLWAADADAMAASLRVHDEVFRSTVAEHDGYVFSTAGDSFAVAFARSSAGAACADALLTRLAAAQQGKDPVLSVRLGLHLGETEERDGDYFGPIVNLAARVMAAAHGGQCLMTRSVAEAAGMTTTDLGAHDLRDIETPVHLFQLGEAEFPPLTNAIAGIVVLPSPRTSLVGREDAVAHVRRLLGASRLVTLTGVGGCGKTRLAIEVARREVATFPEGVWFVDLAAIADEEMIYSAFATATGVMVTDRASATNELIAYFAPRTALLVVDNCEHVIDEVAHLIDDLLSACPRLRVIATSREALEVDGEHAWKVPSLATDGEAATDLFFDRAQAAGVELGGDAATRAVVAEIVGRLDGVPLAIELAAARSRSMPLGEIRDRLDDRFRILAGGKRRSRQRQATLEAAVQWSYDLLDPVEQTALCRLSVFQGGFDPADVGAVVGVDDAEAVDLVDALVAKSLVDITSHGRGALRHRLLETIRLFGLARLVDGGEAEATRDRHLDRFAGDPAGRSMESWVDVESGWRIEREYDNFRAAAEWAIERGRPDATARIGAVLSDAAPRRGDIAAVISWMKLGSALDGCTAVFITSTLGHALNIAGEFATALPLVDEAIAIGRELRCPDVVFALCDLGVAVAFGGDLVQRDELYAEARQIAEELGSANAFVVAAVFGSNLLISDGEYEPVVVLADECRARTTSCGVGHLVDAELAYALVRLARVDDAVEALHRARQVPPSTQWDHLLIVVSALVQAATDGPEVAGRDLAVAAREAVARQPGIAAELLVGFAHLALQVGEPERARRYCDLQAFGNAGMMTHVYDELGDVRPLTRDGRRAFFVAENERISVLDRFANNATLAPVWLAEEIARWS